MFEGSAAPPHHWLVFGGIGAMKLPHNILTDTGGERREAATIGVDLRILADFCQLGRHIYLNNILGSLSWVDACGRRPSLGLIAEI